MKPPQMGDCVVKSRCQFVKWQRQDNGRVSVPFNTLRHLRAGSQARTVLVVSAVTSVASGRRETTEVCPAVHEGTLCWSSKGSVVALRRPPRCHRGGQSETPHIASVSLQTWMHSRPCANSRCAQYCRTELLAKLPSAFGMCHCQWCLKSLEAFP
jgi:hypothetical protein